MLDIYLIGLACTVATGFFMLAVACISLSMAKDKDSWYAREVWAPKSRKDIKDSLVFMAIGLIWPVIVIALPFVIINLVFNGVRDAFRSN